MKLIDVNQEKNRNNEYKKELEELKKAIGDTYENKMNLKYDSCEEIAKKVIKTDEALTKRLNKYAAFRAEYDELMNTKRVRSLTKAENNLARILKSNIDYYDELRDEEFRNLEVRLKSGELSEAEYYNQISILRDAYFEKGSEGWAKYTIKISEYNKKVIDNQKEDIKEMLEGVEDEYSKSLDNILKNQEKTYNKLYGISDVYNRISINGAKEGETYSWLQLSNIDAEIEAIKNYNDSVIKAKKRTDEVFDSLGMDSEKTRKAKELFFSQLSELSIPEATGFSNYLTNISDKKLTDYLSKWVTKIDLSEVISKNLYVGEVETVMEGYATGISNAFSENLADGLSKIPDTFFENGSESANQFKNGFIAAVDEIVLDISEEVSKKVKGIFPDITAGGVSSVNNNSNYNYNIYEAVNPKTTALEIYKQEALKRMLVGE